MPYFHIYSQASSLQNKRPIGNGDCVPLVQHYTKVGNTKTWRQGLRVIDSVHLSPGTVIATFENGVYPSRESGNHACFFLSYGDIDPSTGRPLFINVMDQFKHRKPFVIKTREIHSRGKSKSEGGIYSDSDNADTYYVVW